MSNFVQPERAKTAFSCPQCGALAQQVLVGIPYPEDIEALAADRFVDCYTWSVTVCLACFDMTFWRDSKVVYPLKLESPPPSADLPSDVRETYLEASAIAGPSPRAAAALLRLSVQQLCIALGERGRNINDDIGSLVSKGLPVEVQRALDSVRVVGNNAVHPGEIDFNDDLKTVALLFRLINIIAQRMITDQRDLDELYNSLPNGQLQAIERRDQASPDPAT